MTVTAAEVATTSGQLSSAATWLEHAGQAHARASVVARGAFASLPSAWRGPAATSAVQAGHGLLQRVAPVAPRLAAAGATVRRTAASGAPIADRLRSLERQEEQLAVELRQATHRAVGEADPVLAQQASRQAADAHERLQTVRRLRAQQGELWRQVCDRAGAELSAAAAEVRGALPSFDATPAVGGSAAGGSALRGTIQVILRRLHDLADTVIDWFEVADSLITLLEARLTRWVVQVRTSIVATASHLTLVVGRVAVLQQRRLMVVVTQTRTHLLVPPPVWLRRISHVFGRLRPAISVVGKKLPALGGLLAGWDRWDEDAKRGDTTSTERWLRAGLAGGLRFAPQVVLGILTVKVAAAVGLASGPFAVVTVPAVLAAGLGVSVAVDKVMDWTTRQLLDEWQWSQDLIRGAADGLDASGRWIADRATDAWDGTQQLWRDTTGWAGDTWDSVTSMAGDTWDSVTSMAGDTWDSFTGTAGSAWDSVSGTAGTAWDTATSAGDALWRTTTGAAGSAWDATTSTLGDAASSLLGWTPLVGSEG